MKKTASVVYTIFVIVVLLGVIAYFGWDTYQSRAVRVVDFESRTEEYTRTLADSLAENRDVNAEVEIAEKMMQRDPSLIAVQVYSHDDGLRLSVVKPRAGDYANKALADSEEFSGFISSLRYHTVTRPMRVADMQGLEALYVSATLSGAEIRSNLLIILITVTGLFILTLVMILIRPAGSGSVETEDDDLDAFSSTTTAPEFDDGEFSLDSDNDDFGIPGFDDSSDNDFSDPEPDLPDSFSESVDLDDDFSLPDMDDFDLNEAPSDDAVQSPLLSRLERELERAASFNQDLSLLVFDPDETAADRVRETFNYDDLVFDLGDGRIAVIEINKDLDTALAFTEDFVRDLITSLGNRNSRAGIASRNGRLISADRLFGEAVGALNRTDEEKNIVAFRSDPEKFREYLRRQEDR